MRMAKIYQIRYITHRKVWRQRFHHGWSLMELSHSAFAFNLLPETGVGIRQCSASFEW